MRLLIATQKIDMRDPFLGFFCRWIEEFSKRFESIMVICLEKGEYNLPYNVEVYSLGKEKFKGYGLRIMDYGLLKRLMIAIRFKLIIWRRRKKYDSVLVHMNPEYILIGGLCWKLFRKRIALWYNHPAWNWRVKIASRLADAVFYTSPFSSTARLKKSRQMPVGIDTEQFHPLAGSDPAKDPAKNSVEGMGRILSLGRISKYKRVHIIIAALEILKKNGVQFRASVYGNKVPEEAQYFTEMLSRMEKLKEAGLLSYSPGLPPSELPRLYRENEIFVNATEAGNFDKTILEAMASETLVLTCNPALHDVLPEECRFREDDPRDLAKKLRALLQMESARKKEIRKGLRRFVVENHQLEKLSYKLKTILT